MPRFGPGRLRECDQGRCPLLEFLLVDIAHQVMSLQIYHLPPEPHSAATIEDDMVRQHPAAQEVDALGSPVDIGGYYRPNPEKTGGAMRPSATFNAIVDAL